MRKPAKAAPRRTAAHRGVRPIDPARRPSESALGYLADENDSHLHLLFPVMTITGISDFNDINDLRVSACISVRQTLHLVVCAYPRTAELRAGRRLAGLSAARLGGWAGGNSSVFQALGIGRGGYSQFPTH